MQKHVAVTALCTTALFLSTPRAFGDGPSTTVQAGNENDARKMCVTHFFGKSVSPNIGGEGVIMGGVLVPSGGRAIGIIAPAFALSIGTNIRIDDLTERCKVIEVPNLPGGNYRVRVEDSPTWAKSIAVALTPAGLAAIPIGTGQSLQVNFSVLGTLGLTFQRFWWDNSAASRNTVTIPVGLAIGYGMVQETKAGVEKLNGAFLFGPYLGVRVQF